VVSVDDDHGVGVRDRSNERTKIADDESRIEEDLAQIHELVLAADRCRGKTVGEGSERLGRDARDPHTRELLEPLGLAGERVELAVGGEDPKRLRFVEARQEAHQELVGVRSEGDLVGRREAEDPRDVGAGPGQHRPEDVLPFPIDEACRVVPAFEHGLARDVGPGVMAMGGEVQPFGVGQEPRVVGLQHRGDDIPAPRRPSCPVLVGGGEGAVSSGMDAFEERMRQGGAGAVKEATGFFMKDDPVHGALRAIALRLDALGVPYAVAGGMALVAHGYDRTTVDIDVLVTESGLEAIHERLVGLGYRPAFEGSRKQLRDTERGVRVEFLVSGEFPGDGKPKAVAFPDPATSSVEVGGVRYLRLPTLVELKLASGLATRDVSRIWPMSRSSSRLETCPSSCATSSILLFAKSTWSSGAARGLERRSTPVMEVSMSRSMSFRSRRSFLGNGARGLAGLGLTRLMPVPGLFAEQAGPDSAADRRTVLSRPPAARHRQRPPDPERQPDARGRNRDPPERPDPRCHRKSHPEHARRDLAGGQPRRLLA
jgi:hypothetical protein